MERTCGNQQASITTYFLDVFCKILNRDYLETGGVQIPVLYNRMFVNYRLIDLVFSKIIIFQSHFAQGFIITSEGNVHVKSDCKKGDIRPLDTGFRNCFIGNGDAERRACELKLQQW
jgi:hypothetical protein